ISSFARSWYFARARGSTTRSRRSPRRQIVEPRGAGEIGCAFPGARRLELQDLAAARRFDDDIEREAPPLARPGEALRIRDERARRAFAHAAHRPLHATADAHAVRMRKSRDLVAAGREQQVLGDRNAELALAVVGDLERVLSGAARAAQHLHRMADFALRPARGNPVEAQAARRIFEATVEYRAHVGQARARQRVEPYLVRLLPAFRRAQVIDEARRLDGLRLRRREARHEYRHEKQR